MEKSLLKYFKKIEILLFKECMIEMKIFISGVSCIGKSTIESKLAKIMNYKFYDLDIEIENYFEMPIAKIKSKYLTEYSYRKDASIVLKKIIEDNKNSNYIVALPTSGLMGAYWRQIKLEVDGIILVLRDKPKNILER